MTRALLHARQHAAICNGLECAAPEPVSAPYLQAAYERMRLGVLVDYSKQYGGPGRPFAIFSKEGCLLDCYGSPEAASAAYFALCATLSSSPASSLPDIDDAALAEAPASAFSSPSAAPNPSSVCPVAPGAETPSVLGASNPGAR